MYDESFIPLSELMSSDEYEDDVEQFEDEEEEEEDEGKYSFIIVSLISGDIFAKSKTETAFFCLLDSFEIWS